MRTPLIIGTRGSDLALWQANFVKSLLAGIGLASEIQIIKTQGDLIQHLSFDKLEGKGFFTKEIEEALLNGSTDIAVHSHKDLPTESPEELKIAFVSDREDPSELLLIRKEAVDPSRKFALKKGAELGTSSARRKAQFSAFRPDIILKELRGNVPTRINKLREKNYDAILVAAAGVERLEIDLNDFHVEKLDPKEFIPAPAQGVLAIQIRSSDTELFALLQSLHHTSVANTIGIERKVLNLFQGGCQMPVGVYAEYDEENELYKVRASKAERWDTMPVSVYLESASHEGMAERIVEKIAQVKPCRLFITRDLKEESYLQNVLLGHGFQVEGKAMIETLAVPFHTLPSAEWIFFSSKQAVKYFFRQKPQLGEQKFACVGKATADELRKSGKRADFIGSSTDTKMTGKQFAARVGSEKVLFPQAKGSMRSIQQQFVKPEQVIDLVVYETKKKNEGAAPEADMIVFTSPSNVEAWFERFRIHPGQKVIAMGDATANALRQFGVKQLTKPDAFDDAGIVRAVFGMSGRELEN
ncbi:MAG: hydroxymethylbilane synthase [Bacteroidetes bacterium]|nr:hydroxymethylbilane synthase [Bacteroidota bacterium]MBP6401633.1 hydroxymethylbilane synthase [Bacteroidia bacterium]MBP6649532.1 hydroxymethylbilane synthase [Bacteroidia bacterium]